MLAYKNNAGTRPQPNLCTSLHPIYIENTFDLTMSDTASDSPEIDVLLTLGLSSSMSNQENMWYGRRRAIIVQVMVFFDENLQHAFLGDKNIIKLCASKNKKGKADFFDSVNTQDPTRTIDGRSNRILFGE